MRPVRRPIAASLLALALWFVAPREGHGQADDLPRATLRYDASGDCPDEDALRELVVGRMGYDPFVASDERSVEMVLSGQAHHYVGELSVRVGETVGTRRFESTDCLSVAEALATAIGLVLDPTGRGVAPASAVEPAGAVEPAVVAPPEPPELPPALRPEPEPVPVDGPRVGFVIAAELRGAVGLAPEPTLGGELGVGVEWDALRVLVEARFESTLGPVGADRARIELSQTTAGLAACAVLDWWIGCGSVDVGMRRVTASVVSEPGPFESPSANVRVRSGLRLAIAPGELRVQLELAIPLVPLTLELEGRPVWSTSPITGSLLLGGGFSLF